MSKTAALISHSHPPQATEAVRIAARVAAEAGWRLIATAGELSKHGEAADGVEEADLPASEVDLCLVLGGDGSILYALRRFAGSGVPVFGVNFGTVGFLAAVERDQAEEGIRRAFDGESEKISLPGLELEMDGSLVAVNDVSFSRRPQDRVAELSYRIAGEEVGHVRCDGLVAATPVGSTGYNLANQGPILAWGVAGYVVSYISPHSLTARALVVAPDRRPPRRQRRRARAGRRRRRRRPGRLARAWRRARGPLRRRGLDPGPAARHQLLPADPREVRPPGRLIRPGGLAPREPSGADL